MVPDSECYYPVPGARDTKDDTAERRRDTGPIYPSLVSNECDRDNRDFLIYEGADNYSVVLGRSEGYDADTRGVPRRPDNAPVTGGVFRSPTPSVLTTSDDSSNVPRGGQCVEGARGMRGAPNAVATRIMSVEYGQLDAECYRDVIA